LKKTPRLEPSLKSWRPQRRRRLVEWGRGHGGRPTLPARSFPVHVWAQYRKSARDNDEILNLRVGSHNQPPLFVHRKRAFVHITTLLFGKMGYGHLKEMPTCVGCGVRENWPAPNGVYSIDGVEEALNY
jgi:hypothetical protein